MSLQPIKYLITLSSYISSATCVYRRLYIIITISNDERISIARRGDNNINNNNDIIIKRPFQNGRFNYQRNGFGRNRKTCSSGASENPGAAAGRPGGGGQNPDTNGHNTVVLITPRGN